MRITILGTGTSTGVPVPACECSVCQSKDRFNTRLRTGAYIEVQKKDLDGSREHGSDDTVGGILIDTNTDLRAQAIQHKLARIDAVFFTHSHADHIHGIDDLRGFNFARGAPISLYANEETASELEQKFPYCFSNNPEYEGGAPPELGLNRVEPYQVVEVCGTKVLTLLAKHGSRDVLGFRIGDFAYLTDCSGIPEETREHLKDLKVLILDGLRNRPHRTHFTHQQAAREAEIIKAEKTYLTHISHDVDHHEANAKLKSSCNVFVECAYDGMVFEL